MGLCIIFGIILAVGIIFVVVDKCESALFFIGWVIIGLFTIALGVCIGVIIATQLFKQINYEDTIYQKQVLEYRLEKLDDNLVGNELIYNEIVAFNQNLKHIKRYYNNFFLKGFYNDKIATIDYIVVDDIIPLENK